MAEGTGRGRIYAVFSDNVEAMRRQAALQAAAARGGPAPEWQHPDGVESTLDVPGTSAGFDRTEANASYEEILLGAGAAAAAVGVGAVAAVAAVVVGTTGDAASCKIQVDLVAVHERGYRARHCTPIRLAAMSTACRAGHGHPNGPLAGDAVGFAQDMLRAGQ